jgi:colicin import membrane protein
MRSLLVVSFGAHLVLYYLLAVFHFSPTHLREEPVYYVDITNLPVANPRQGTPAVGTVPQPTAAAPEMQQPVPAPPRTAAKPAAEKSVPAKPAESAKEFDERMAKIARSVEAQHAESAIDALRKRVAAGSKGSPGMPTATGTESGSSYAAFIQSRLSDAFRETISYQSKNPEMFVRLTIDRNGRVVGQKVERSSRDLVFENSVRRAIAKAEANFPPPPDGKLFEFGFVFRPQGVGIGKH